MNTHAQQCLPQNSHWISPSLRFKETEMFPTCKSRFQDETLNKQILSETLHKLMLLINYLSLQTKGNQPSFHRQVTQTADLSIYPSYFCCATPPYRACCSMEQKFQSTSAELLRTERNGFWQFQFTLWCTKAKEQIWFCSQQLMTKQL